MTSIKRPMLSPPKQISAQLLLSKVTSNYFFDFQMKKNSSKTITTKLYPANECKEKIRNNAYKINVSQITFTLLLIYKAKFV